MFKKKKRVHGGGSSCQNSYNFDLLPNGYSFGKMDANYPIYISSAGLDWK